METPWCRHCRLFQLRLHRGLVEGVLREAAEVRAVIVYYSTCIQGFENTALTIKLPVVHRFLFRNAYTWWLVPALSSSVFAKRNKQQHTCICVYAKISVYFLHRRRNRYDLSLGRSKNSKFGVSRGSSSSHMRYGGGGGSGNGARRGGDRPSGMEVICPLTMGGGASGMLRFSFLVVGGHFGVLDQSELTLSCYYV